jgi:hypothetical protein
VAHLGTRLTESSVLAISQVSASNIASFIRVADAVRKNSRNQDGSQWRRRQVLSNRMFTHRRLVIRHLGKGIRLSSFSKDRSLIECANSEALGACFFTRT